MKPNVNRLIKLSMLEGLKKNQYSLARACLVRPSGGIFTSPQEIDQALNIATNIFQSWQVLASQDPGFFPSDPLEIEKFIDIHIADRSTVDAILWINRNYRDRSNQTLAAEARAGISELRRLGEEKKAATYEFILQQTLDELASRKTVRAARKDAFPHTGSGC
jgi:hypothetical protein